MNKKKKPLACINGVKGAISLIMAVLMTPFLTIAMLLVETGRYNSTVSLLDEALGVSAVSLLADYDPYLQNRWGLLALSQEADLDKEIVALMDTNTSFMGGSFSLSNTRAEGMYSLAETDVLRFQVLEYSKLNAPTKLASELISTVTSMLKFVEKLKDKVQIFEKGVETLTSGVKILDSALELTKKTEELEKSANTLDALAGEYESDYATFESKVNTLIDNLKSVESLQDELDALEEELADLQEELDELLGIDKDDPTAPTNPENDEIRAKRKEIEEKEEDIKEKNTELTRAKNKLSPAITAAKQAKTDYADVVGRIAAELKNFRELAAEVLSTLKDLNDNILSGVGNAIDLTATVTEKRKNLEEKEEKLKTVKEEVAAMEDQGYDEDDSAYREKQKEKATLEEEVQSIQEETSALETELALAEATNNSLGEMHEELGETFEDYSEHAITVVENGFTNLKTKIQNLNIDGLKHSSRKITRSEYHGPKVEGYMPAEEIHKYIEEQEKELKEGTLSAVMDALTTLYNSIMGTSLFFVDDLSAVLDLSYFEENFDGLPGGTNTTGDVISLVTSLGSALKDAATLTANLQGYRFWEILDTLSRLGHDLIDLFIAIVEFLKTVVSNIGELLMGPDRILLSTYCTYNLTCRTDFNTSKSEMSLITLTGYSVGKDSFPENTNKAQIPVFGEFYQLVNTITQCMNGTGADRTFSGAELEYVLFGSNSEVANQLYVFCALYIIRAVLCIPAITGNAEVQSLAAAATLGYPVVMGLYYLLEPLVQTILLANGKDQPMIPTTVYLSPSGIPKLLAELVKFLKFTDKEKEDIKSKMIKAIDGSQENYDYNAKLYEYTNSPEYDAIDTPDFSYRDFCLVLMIMTVRQERMVERLANVIQMETLCYYTNEEEPFTFDLRKSFTYVQAETDATVSQIIPDLIESSIFNVHREQYRGY
ncbi:MAG: hypothetical protein IJ960_09245 [Oscillospiraceae bacterium]|nr:hypothetical protein [Oscillospiraceae bacterium]